MKIELKSTQELIDDVEVTIWWLDKNEGAIVYNINKLLNEDVIECWFENNQKYIEVMYSDWDSNELLAIINTHGHVIRKGIQSIEKFLEEQELFIISITGMGLGGEALYYNLADDDEKMAVIDSNGKFIIILNMIIFILMRMRIYSLPKTLVVKK
jgi:hypothetical protein